MQPRCYGLVISSLSYPSIVSLPGKQYYIYGDSEDILYATRQGLEDDHPEVVEWFDNFMLNDEQLGSLMAELNEADSEEAGAQKWIDENQDLINEWIGESE